VKQAIDRFRDEVGYVLLTVTRVEPLRRATVVRVWSSHPALYPLNDTKPIDAGDWMSIVEQRLPVVCDQPADLQAFFPADAQALLSLGCGAGINVPAFEADVLLGCVNAFHEAGWFTPQRVVRARQLAADFFRNDS
jgi:hypothetical protein